MIRPRKPNAHRIVAFVPVRPADRDRLEAPFASSTVLGHTLLRLARSRRLDGIVLLHDAGHPPPEPPDAPRLRQRLTSHAASAALDDALRPMRLAARKWAPTCWRGGLGGASCFDEPLAPAAMAEALDAVEASAALIVAPDWPLIDPRLCDAVIERHLQRPEALKLVFTQAAPGLAPCLIDRELLAEIRDKGAMIGAMLDYQPRLPQGDPIAKEMCVQVEHAVRPPGLRAVFDAPRWRRLLRHVEAIADPADLLRFDAAQCIRLLHGGAHLIHHPLPQQATVEINTERFTRPRKCSADNGAPHTWMCEEPMTLEAAGRLFGRLAAEPDTALTLGGRGDPLLHTGWADIVRAAVDAGIHAIHIETDLIVEQDVLQTLLDLPLDVLSIHLHADTAETYRRLMGFDGFAKVIGNIEWLLSHRPRKCRPGLPWIVPRLGKTPQNVGELETFFDRWVHHCGHAIVEPPPENVGGAAGCGLRVAS